MDFFSRVTRAWFDSNFEAPTRVQQEGWPQLVQAKNALLLAPTGSGKTLAAFLWAIDVLGRLPVDTPPGVRVLYVSPLKALVYDVERNLRAPLIGIRRLAEQHNETIRPVQVDIRTGRHTGPGPPSPNQKIPPTSSSRHRSPSSSFLARGRRRLSEACKP